MQEFSETSLTNLGHSDIQGLYERPLFELVAQAHPIALPIVTKSVLKAPRRKGLDMVQTGLFVPIWHLINPIALPMFL